MKGAMKLLLIVLSVIIFVTGIPNKERLVLAETTEKLKEVYGDYFMIGTCADNSYFSSSSAKYRVLSEHFNAITAENMMKPESLQATEGDFTFAQADRLVKSTLSNDMTMIGHTLAWHQQSPKWMNSGVGRDEAIRNLENHIAEVISHFGDDVYSWDVVNEAFNDSVTDPSNWRGALRDTPWKKAIGSDYLEIAFKAARKANPNIKLYYNDYNMDNPSKREAAYYMAKEFLEKDIPIDGIGMQGHYNMMTSVAAVEASILRFKELGLAISITELDVTVNEARGQSKLSEKLELAQAQKYAQLFKVFKENADAIERVTFWGISDAASWRRESFPLIFNSKYEPKQAFYAVADPDKFLEENPIAKPDADAEAKTANAAYGKAEIGGDESQWKNAEEIKVNNYIMAWQGATGTAKVLWDEKNLYVLFKVTDSVLNDSSVNPHEEDSVEIFLDETNGKMPFYENDDSQYRINYKNVKTYGATGEPKTGKVVSYAAAESGGYTVQAQIPFRKIKGEKGLTIGFDLQINDANAQGMRVSIAKWNDLTDNSFQSVSGFGNLTLK
ncbi:MAG: endo-1,4-beta-xylanase [Clostridiales bacterium]|jgi:endo-1,4-beta-xylanase|nr:endo-1,4-beta-xylanase [Clostridiales bacterium]